MSNYKTELLSSLFDTIHTDLNITLTITKPIHVLLGINFKLWLQKFNKIINVTCRCRKSLFSCWSVCKVCELNQTECMTIRVLKMTRVTHTAPTNRVILRSVCI